MGIETNQTLLLFGFVGFLIVDESEGSTKPNQHGHNKDKQVGTIGHDLIKHSLCC